MARKGKSVYERINDITSEINSTEQHLINLKTQLDSLLKERDNLEMHQAWQSLKDRGLGIEDLQNLLQNMK